MVQFVEMVMNDIEANNASGFVWELVEKMYENEFAGLLRKFLAKDLQKLLFASPLRYQLENFVSHTVGPIDTYEHLLHRFGHGLLSLRPLLPCLHFHICGAYRISHAVALACKFKMDIYRCTCKSIF